MDDGVKFWLLALLALFCFWLISGGYNSNFAKGGFFLKPPAPLDSGSPYGSLSGFNLIPSGNFSYENSDPLERIKNANDPESIERELDYVASEIKKASDAALASEYKGKFTLRLGSYGGTDVNREYLEINASPNLVGKVLITGWQVRSAMTYKSGIIGKAAPLPFTDQINQEDPIFVSAGQTVYVNTGRSPIGISFRVNLCSGYFGQFQEYNPYLRNDCPRPSDENLPVAPNNLSDSCLDYLDGLGSCRIQIDSLPSNINQECKNYISNKINYPACLLNHKKDLSFYKPEWRVFLKQDVPLWKNRREVIQLIDHKGKIVDSISY